MITLGQASLDPNPHQPDEHAVVGATGGCCTGTPVLDGEPHDVIRAAIDDLDRRALGLLVELLTPTDRIGDH